LENGLYVRDSDGLGVGVASALTPSQVQGWAFNHDSPSGLQDAAAAAAAAGGWGWGWEWVGLSSLGISKSRWSK
jgi:hypothetical protein